MLRKLLVLFGVAAVFTSVAQAQQPARPPIATTKVEGTEGVYVFRNVNHQSMFVVTNDGVIVTDRRRVQGGGGLFRQRNRRGVP